MPSWWSVLNGIKYFQTAVNTEVCYRVSSTTKNATQLNTTRDFDAFVLAGVDHVRSIYSRSIYSKMIGNKYLVHLVALSYHLRAPGSAISRVFGPGLTADSIH